MTPKTFLEVILVCVLLAAWSVNVHTEFHDFVNIHLDFYRESSFGFIFYTESLFPGVRNVKSVCKVTACTGCFRGTSFCSSIVPRHYMEPTFGEYCSCGPTSTQITMLRNRLIGRMARVTGVYSSVLNCQSRSEMRSSDMNCFLRHQQCQSAFGLLRSMKHHTKIQRLSYNPLAVSYLVLVICFASVFLAAT